MQYTKLGRTDIEVSRICLGTMTWGTQNSESDGHQQMDHALGRGVTFWDTAEMYPIMGGVERAGRTEEIIGTWLQKNPSRRSEIVLATKITGNGNKSVRNGRGIDAKEIKIAIEGSLRRLKTDYVDLYQFHWPQRGSYHFQQQWDYHPESCERAEARDNLLESLQAVGDLVAEGKVRAFGVSDDSVWGAMELLRLCRSAWSAASAIGAERIQPVVPAVRYRLGGSGLLRGCRPAGMVAAGDGLVEREVS